MAISRRDCLKISLLGGLGTAVGGCAHIANRLADHGSDVRLPAGNVDATTRLVNRVTFGPRPGDIAKVKALGHSAYVEALLNPAEDEDLRLQFLLNRLDVFQMDPYETQELPENEVIRQLQQSAILRATYGKHQLRERLVDFWTNHFNIYGRKGLAAFRKPGDEANVIRKHALDTFPNLLAASAHSPAMLVYLDNQGNTSAHPNENYAREIMELHTMGVKSGYTQKDVQEVARCFTGWTFEKRFLHHRWSFRFDETTHDNGEKVVLGHRIAAGGGEKDADHVLNILANHPATAHHIASKLCAYFLGSADEKWVDRTAQTFLQTKGDIPSMVRPMLLSKELLEGTPILKRPFDFMTSALRAMEADTDGSLAIQEHLVKMGEPLYLWPMPDGYPSKTSSWTGSMLPRWNFALALTSGQIKGTGVDWDAIAPTLEPQSLFERTHARRAAAGDKELMTQVSAELASGSEGHTNATFLCLASPSFQWR